MRRERGQSWKRRGESREREGILRRKEGMGTKGEKAAVSNQYFSKRMSFPQGCSEGVTGPEL